MGKTLLVIPYQIENQDGFDEVVKKFKNKEYNIKFFNEINEFFDVKALPCLLEDIPKNEEVVILSNVKDLIFTWYRCYNSLINDFIYFIDKSDLDLFQKSTLQDDFYTGLANFLGIEAESVEGKIYLNLTDENYRNVFPFLLANNNFQFFNPINNFNYKNKKEKNIIEKVYSCKGFKFDFTLNKGEDAIKEELITIEGKCTIDLQLNEEFLNLLRKHFYFTYYFVIGAYEHFENRTKILKLVFEWIGENWDIKEKEVLYNKIINYIEKEDKGFLTKVYFQSLLTRFKLKNNLLKRMLKTLLEDNEHMEYHYPILASNYPFADIDGLPMYEDIYKDREEEIMRLVDYYKPNIDINPPESRRDKHIAIIVNRLLSLNFSDTSLLFDHIKYLNKYYPEYKVKIFVEDTSLYDDSEVVIPFFFTGPPSSKLEVTHRNHLRKERIRAEIFYSSTEKSRRERIQEMIDEINNFAPEVIWCFGGGFNSLVKEFLYPHYPILHRSTGSLSNTSNVDVYIRANNENSMKKRKKYGLLERKKVYKHSPAFEFPESYKEVTRSDYNIGEDEFVMVTVGTRLDAEMSEEFIDMICSFLKDKADAKWIIVGPAELLYLKSNYINLFKKQIITIEYEEDLAALYKICDIYVNPFRDRGGLSAAIAMNEGVPVVTLNKKSDVLVYVGKENAVFKDKYLEEVNKLYKDKNYRLNLEKKMKRKVKNTLSFKKTISELINYFEMAIDRFNNRTEN